MPAALTPEQKKERYEAKQAERESKSRRVRGVFNGTAGKLTVDTSRLESEGYHPHIFNDTPGRIQQALANGYEFVNPNEVDGLGVNVVSRNTAVEEDKIRFLVGSNQNGEPLYAYLMKTKQEWWEEDQAAIQARNDMTDTSIRRGKTPGIDTDGFYVPKGGGINMET